MDDESDETPLPPPKLSKTPSWVTLGFILGALFVLALPRRPAEAPPVLQPVREEPVRASGPRQLMTIEAVFAKWGREAVWSHDVTEVALWNSDQGKFSDYYEIIRNGEVFYFRSIDRLTRPLLKHGQASGESPLQFTETEEQLAEWLKSVDEENQRAFSAAARKAFGGSQAVTPPDPKQVIRRESPPPKLTVPTTPIIAPPEPKSP